MLPVTHLLPPSTEGVSDIRHLCSLSTLFITDRVVILASTLRIQFSFATTWLLFYLSYVLTTNV